MCGACTMLQTYSECILNSVTNPQGDHRTDWRILLTKCEARYRNYLTQKRGHGRLPSTC
jgi:hypothetical protein